MASLFSSIGPGAFSSQVGQRIEGATDSSLSSEDWTLILETCDIINETDEGPKDAIKAIRKRLSNHKQYKSILYTLTLIEACVKNCGPRFHKQIATKEFLSDFTKLLGQKGQPSNLPQVVQEKVLSLIQAWSDAFRNAPELQSISQTYNSLKAHGYEFPAQDLDTLSPIYTPARSELAGPPPAEEPRVERARGPAVQHTGGVSAAPPLRHQNVSGPINPTPEQMAKLRNELDIVEGNVRVLSEMLLELQPGQEQQNDYTLLVELNKTCREMQKRIVQLVDRIANEEVTGVLLRINDDLNNVFIRYDRYERNRKPIVDESNGLDNTVATEISHQATTREPSLIDFGDLTTSSSTTRRAEDAEFDMFAQSRSSTFADSRATGSTYDDNREDVPNESIAQMMAAKGPYPQQLTPQEPQQQQVKTVEDDIEDVEEWLKGTDLAKLEAEEREAKEAALRANLPKYTVQTSEPNTETMTSSEFDQFLSDRASAGSQRLSQQVEPPRQMTNLAGDKRSEDMYGL